MRSAASPPVDELEERRPLTEAARSPFALPPSDSPWQRARERLRRNLGLDRNGANVLDQNLLSSIGAAIRAQVSATPMAAGGNEGTAGAPRDGEVQILQNKVIEQTYFDGYQPST